MKLPHNARYGLFRIGSAAKGLVYLLMGVFCLAAAVGVARSTGGPQEIIRWLGSNPFGRIVYFLLGLGLLAYSVWRWYKFFANPQRDGWFSRVNSISVGVAYAGLALYTFMQFFREQTGEDVRKDLLQHLLSFSWGEAAVYLIAVLVVGAGVAALQLGISNQHMKDVEHWELTERQESVFRNIGRTGLSGVAIVYFIMAWSLFRVGQQQNGNEFRGVGESLAALEGWTIGWWLLALTGVGLLAYGIFMFLRVKYERV
ncbi:DUF1206 domain-containing protein [Neolewinella persica]|uniref:DUF1206 domain-containing protein n=1 Tax=Neolewinella persica TaxID=70998 RepID=UPI00035E1D68|nr:DUF1206 domain-containing protein [Neolewinella persica]